MLVMGDKSGLTDDCTSGESRDRSSLDLPGVQEDLVRAVVATGTPVVLVLVAGRPCGSAWLHEHSAAVLLAWLPGQEGGEAIAEALTGERQPRRQAADLVSAHAGQIPVFYGHKVSGGRSHWKGDYVDGAARAAVPVRPRPELHDASRSTARRCGADGRAGTSRSRSTSRSRNTGDRAGDEVVQLYVRDPQASVTRPVLELKGFQRVELAAGAVARR